jgi:hypothetical protein
VKIECQLGLSSFEIIKEVNVKKINDMEKITGRRIKSAGEKILFLRAIE